MSRVDFYHLQKQSLEDVLPKLLLKVYSSGKKAVVRIGTPERVEHLNTQLWIFQDESFLPHGSKKDGFAIQQPIWLTSDNDNPNQAEYLFVVDGAEAEVAELSNYERVFNIFDGLSEAALHQARILWKNYKNAGFEVYYWQQSDNGKWEQKA